MNAKACYKCYILFIYLYCFINTLISCENLNCYYVWVYEFNIYCMNLTFIASDCMNLTFIAWIKK